MRARPVRRQPDERRRPCADAPVASSRSCRCPRPGRRPRGRTASARGRRSRVWPCCELRRLLPIRVEHARRPGCPSTEVAVVARELIAGASSAVARPRRGERELVRLLRLERAARARPLALALHRALEALAVDRQAALAGDVLHEVERHAERVVEPERGVAGQRRASPRPPGRALPRAAAGPRSAPRRSALPRCGRPGRRCRGCGPAPDRRRPTRARRRRPACGGTAR